MACRRGASGATDPCHAIATTGRPVANFAKIRSRTDCSTGSGQPTFRVRRGIADRASGHDIPSPASDQVPPRDSGRAPQQAVARVRGCHQAPGSGDRAAGSEPPGAAFQGEVHPWLCEHYGPVWRSACLWPPAAAGQRRPIIRRAADPPSPRLCRAAPRPSLRPRLCPWPCLRLRRPAVTIRRAAPPSCRSRRQVTATNPPGSPCSDGFVTCPARTD